MFILAVLGAFSFRNAPVRIQPLSGDLMLITEILFDPDPSVGLPPFEFVEWMNAGNDTVNLVGWKYVVGDKERLIAGGRVAPGGFVIVCSPAAAASFRPFGAVIPMESFPALRNTGDRITLISPGGKEVHSVYYSPDRFSGTLQANGGWSLELADISQYCNPGAWVPSRDPSGGTPGRANSQVLSVTAADPALLLRAAGYDEGSFVVLFSASLNNGMDLNNYSCLLMPGEKVATAIPSREYGFPGLFFQLPGGLDDQMTYTLELLGNPVDCSGVAAVIRPVSFGFPWQPDSAGLVITEIMFDPVAGQPEFVEVFNRSDRMIDLQDIILARAGMDGVIRDFSDQQTFSYWLFPGCFGVFTSNEQLFRKSWPLADPAIIAERMDLPALTNEESRLILMNRQQKKLDVAVYSPDWHYPYLDDEKGISLERIDFGASGADRSNWFSASAASGGATPGLKNSASHLPEVSDNQEFSLFPANGYASTPFDAVQVTLNYRFDSPGWFLRVRIFNAGGIPVKEIFPFGLARQEGVVCWDGLDSAQRLAPDGIYLVVADFYFPSGKKGRWKKACSLVRAY